MGDLYKRVGIATIGTGGTEGIRVQSRIGFDGVMGPDLAFKCVRTLKRTPNTMELSIWNLNPDNRAAITEQRNFPVTLEVGYESGTHLIFRGDGEARVERDGPDLIVQIEAADGGRRHQVARTQRTVAPGTSIGDALQAVAADAGLGEGNIRSVLQGLSLEGVASRFSGGATFSGQATTQLDRIARSAGLEYSVQEGAIQLLERGRPLSDRVTLLTPSTGLIGAPTRSSEGVVEARALILPDLLPGAKVRIDAAEVSGYYRVEKGSYVGETFGTEWAVDLECKEL